MILDESIPELKSLRTAERQLAVLNENSFEDQVIASLNDHAPVHRWFRFKEAFAHSLLKNVMLRFVPGAGKEFSLLDPFCGTGTSLVAAQELSKEGYHIRGTGIERNPFVHFVASIKTHVNEIDLVEYDALRGRLFDFRTRQVGLPCLSSIASGRCISRHAARRIVELRDVIRKEASGPTRDALLLGLAASVEPLSRIRKDGRALRIVKKTRTCIDGVISKKWQMIRDDAADWQKNYSDVPSKVLLGDGRKPLDCGVEAKSVDLVLTSPPYPNNIDYSEVYKLELWLLGFVEDHKSFYELRRSTFRSHPSIRPVVLPDDLEYAINNGCLRRTLAPLLRRLESEGEKWRLEMLRGYFVDMWSFMKDTAQCLKQNGKLVVVIGNSLHGDASLSFLVPTDLVVASMAHEHGLGLEANAVARALKRRIAGNHFLRESLVVMTKR